MSYLADDLREIRETLALHSARFDEICAVLATSNRRIYRLEAISRGRTAMVVFALALLAWLASGGW